MAKANYSCANTYDLGVLVPKQGRRKGGSGKHPPSNAPWPTCIAQSDNIRPGTEAGRCNMAGSAVADVPLPPPAAACDVRIA